MQDRKGFFWLATKDGLNKYDGYSFKVYRNQPGNPASLSQNWIQTMGIDRNDDLWLATKTGFEHFSPVTEKFSRVDLSIKGVPDNRIYPVYALKQDTILSNGRYLYLATTYVLLRFDTETRKNEVIHKLEQPENLVVNITFIKIDSKGVVWFGTNKNRIGSYDPVSGTKRLFTLVPSDPALPGSDYVSGIDEDGNGRIFTVTNSYIWVLEPGAAGFRFFMHSPKVYRESGFISAMILGVGGTLTVGVTEQGVYNYSFETGLWDKLIPHESEQIKAFLKHPASLFIDRTRNLWIGLNGYGAMILARGQNRFEKIYNVTDGVNIRSIRGFLPVNDTTVYLSGYGLFARFDPKSREAKTVTVNSLLNTQYFNNNIYQISLNRSDGGRTLWMTSEGDGLYRYDPGAEMIEKIIVDKSVPGINSTNYLFQFVQDEKNTLWIATETGLVNYDPSTGKWRGFPGNSELEKILRTERMISVNIDTKGRLLIGSDRNGLLIFDPKTGVIKRYYFERRKPGTGFAPSIRSIVFDSKGNTWLGTSNGLVKFNENGRSLHYTVASGLPNDMVYGILEDKRGYLWLSTNKGLSRFDPVKESFNNFTVDDGLQNNEFNTAAFAAAPDGTFYFGGIEGFNMFDPLKVSILEEKPDVVLTNLKLFSRDIPLQPGVEGALLDTSTVFKKFIRLNHSQNDITFEVAGLDINSNARILYSFRLDGYNDEWSQPSLNRLINFTNLSPGEYTLLVKAANKDGIWSGETALMTIVITPPFWQTWWFILLTIAVVALSVYGSYLYRVRTIKLQNEKLEALIKVRTRELEEYKDILIGRQRDLESSNSALEEANRSKDRFFSMFAHDLKSPFYGILGYLDILHDEFDDLTESEKREFIGSVNRVSKDLYLFIENVLDLFRIELGRVSFMPEYFSPSLKIEPVLNILALNLSSKRLEVKVEIPPELVIYSDQHMFSTIVQNLVSNAIKYSNPGGIIKVTAETGEKYARFSVIDRGVGMTPEVCAKLFNRETVYSSEGTQQEKGTGLGLMICKEFVERNGGRIKVESQPGSGTTFSFTLPLRKSNPED